MNISYHDIWEMHNKYIITYANKAQLKSNVQINVWIVFDDTAKNLNQHQLNWYVL